MKWFFSKKKKQTQKHDGVMFKVERKYRRDTTD